MDEPIKEFEEFDFDFLTRKSQLDAIVKKWSDLSVPKQAYNYLEVITQNMRDLIFSLVDEGFRTGQETIKRNFDFATLGAQSVAPLSLAGYCLGLEYGSSGLQQTPVTSENIPDEVKEMWVVAFQPMNELCLKLLSDIFMAGNGDEEYLLDKQAEFNVAGYELVTSCYRLGVATAAERRMK